jgi:hypothetical protein
MQPATQAANAVHVTPRYGIESNGMSSSSLPRRLEKSCADRVISITRSVARKRGTIPQW